MNFKIKKTYEYQLFYDYARRYKLKSSRKRKFIMDYFLMQDKHLSAEELYQQVKNKMPNVGYSTIYRTLKLLVLCGLATARQFEKGITRYEPIHHKEHHDHFICTSCGRIIEFCNQKIEDLQRQIARRYRFLIYEHKLEIYGMCPKCKKKEKR